MNFSNCQPVYLASSIKELSEHATLPAMDNKTKVELYMRSADNILQQAQIYKLEGDLEQAFILLMKFAILVVEKIPKHKGYPESISPLKKQIRQKAAQVMNEMDIIKAHLNKLYAEKLKQEEEAEQKKIEAERQRIAEQEQKRKREEEEEERMKTMSSPTVSAPPPMTEIPLNPTSVWFPETAPPAYAPPMEGFPGFPSPPEGVPPPEYAFPPQDPVPPEFNGTFLPPNMDVAQATAPSLIDIPNDELTSALPQKLDVGNLQKLSLEYQGPTPEPTPEKTPTTQDVAYPNPSPMSNIPNYKPTPKPSPAPSPTPFIHPQMPPPAYMFPPNAAPMMAMPPAFPVYGAPVPMGPPGMVLPNYAPVKATAPVAPPKSEPVKNETSTPPTPKRSKLRNMAMDGGMFQVFMELAKPNTVKDIETCGILAGTLKNNAFQVTTLIIPKQTGTSDTCAMTHEDELFQYQQDNNLMTLGWIHTHPSHDCFLSSVDMHTHMSYQLMLDEAVAVVVAPKVTPNFGIFRLNEFGMADIQSCDKRGFHPHQKGLYNTTEHVNVQFNGSSSYKVVDLRKK